MIIYGIGLLFLGILGLVISYKRKLKDAYDDIFDKTNIYLGLIGGAVAIVFGIVIIVMSFSS